MSGLIDIALDWETKYTSDYSLRKMQNAQYVMDERFEAIGVSIKVAGQAPRWITGDFGTLRLALATLPWHKIRVIAHNVRFDGSILEWRFGFKPAAYFCTMVGSRPHVLPYTGSVSLRSVANYLQVGTKGDEVINALNKGRLDFTPEQMAAYADYCCNDTELAWKIADHLLKIIPDDEQRMIDLTLKKYLRPALALDVPRLEARLEQVKADKDDLATDLQRKYGIFPSMLTSNQKFAEVLRPFVAELPMKKNKKGQDTFAFAKGDPAMKQLVADPRVEVREIILGRLAFKSTQEEARLSRLIDLARTMGGMLPVPTVYYGAHTGRGSGDEKINMQNLPRVEYDKLKNLVRGHLRFCVVAREGYEIVVADFSNIEARLVATLAGQWDLVDAFRNNKDVYSEFASMIYGFAVNKKDHPIERFVGKSCILGLGYGMGAERFRLRMAEAGIIFTIDECKRIVGLYRKKYPKIPELWSTLDQLAHQVMMKPGGLYVWGPLTFAHHRIILPNGMPIIYNNLRVNRKLINGQDIRDGLCFDARNIAWANDADLDPDDDTSHRASTAIWGGTFLENISQGLAAIIAKGAELKLTDMNIITVLQAHDELVFHIPKQLVPQVIKAVEHTMTIPVSWLPQLPIAVESGRGASYGDAK